MSAEITKDELKDVFGYDEELEAAKAAEKAKIFAEELAKEREAAREEAIDRLRGERDKLERARTQRRLDELDPSADSSTQDVIREVCDSIRDFLLDKNAQYGDSAINPVRIFSKASPVEQLLVRIDDKLSRIEKGDDRIESDEDVVDDLIGYFILLKVAKEKGLS